MTDKMEAKDVNLWLWASSIAVRHAAEAISVLSLTASGSLVSQQPT